ncbi:MAG: long-chain fatty acid--CoA ligase [Saprospiraceae bacterium]|nr:long-chain fatty acid--CoA ligase [Saprospiraceae bacterium]
MAKVNSYIVPHQFKVIADRMGSKVAMRHKKYGLWQEISWSEYYQESLKLASALIEMGVKKGDFVGVIGENCPEWLYVDMAAQMVGATSVGIYTTNAWPQVKYVVEHSECKVLFAEDEEQVDKWLKFRKGVPFLEKVVYWEDKGLTSMDDDHLERLENLLELGASHLSKNKEIISERSNSITEDDTAILVYTSGTTGNPKGAMLTNKNLLWAAEAIANIDNGSLISEEEEIMSFLPLCHIFERTFSVYLHLVMGYTINFVESIDTVPQNLREIHPTIGYAVPRIWEKFYSKIYIQMEDADWFNRQVYKWAIGVATKYQANAEAGKSQSPLVSFGNLIAQKAVFYFLKERLGMEKMRYGLSGAAPISPEILRFYKAIGLTLVEGYGMTETSATISFSTMNEHKYGTVGKPIPGSEFQIAEDGEILSKHPGIFKGYYKNPEATNAALNDGWISTGDIGEIDDEGYVKIVDRKKDLIITAGGKNIAPQYIENKLKFSPYINDAIVIGDRRKFLSAILVLDEENINKYAQDNKIQYSTYADLAENEEVLKLLDKEVNGVNRSLAKVQNIRKYKVLNKRLYQEDGEMTPTMKVKRNYINETYSDLIESIYA